MTCDNVPALLHGLTEVLYAANGLALLILLRAVWRSYQLNTHLRRMNERTEQRRKEVA